MKNGRAVQSVGGKRVLGVFLLFAACFFIILAVQSVSTEKYVLYRENLPRYIGEMEECESLTEGPYAANYQYLAFEWRELADDAKGYLTQHRIGAASLVTCALLCIAAGAYLIISSLTVMNRRRNGNS